MLNASLPKRLGWEELSTTTDWIYFGILAVVPIVLIAQYLLNISFFSSFWKFQIFAFVIVIPLATVFCQAKKVIRKIRTKENR